MLFSFTCYGVPPRALGEVRGAADTDACQTINFSWLRSRWAFFVPESEQRRNCPGQLSSIITSVVWSTARMLNGSCYSKVTISPEGRSR